MALAYETNIAFSSTIQSQKPFNSVIINCYASAEDIFSKIISEKEVAVFGEYKVLVFYRQPNASKEASYKSFTLRKNFCEIVLFDTLEKSEIKAELLLQPSCKYNYISKSRLRSFWNIEVSGEIRVSCIACDTDNSIKNINSVNAVNSDNSLKPIADTNSINNIVTANSSNTIGTINLAEIVNRVNSTNITDTDMSDISAPTALTTKSCGTPFNSTKNKDSVESEDVNNTKDNTDTQNKDFYANTQENIEYNISSRTWQFEDSDSSKVEEMMYMDFDALKNIDKD